MQAVRKTAQQDSQGGDHGDKQQQHHNPSHAPYLGSERQPNHFVVQECAISVGKCLAWRDCDGKRRAVAGKKDNDEIAGLDEKRRASGGSGRTGSSVMCPSPWLLMLLRRRCCVRPICRIGSACLLLHCCWNRGSSSRRCTARLDGVCCDHRDGTKLRRFNVDEWRPSSFHRRRVVGGGQTRIPPTPSPARRLLPYAIFLFVSQNLCAARVSARLPRCRRGGATTESGQCCAPWLLIGGAQ